MVFTMTFFAAMVVLPFSFAFLKGDEVVANVAPGILWVAIPFAGTLGLSRAFDRERESDTMRGLPLSPASRTAIFLGKALAILSYMLIVELVVVPMVALLFDVPLFDYPLALVTTLAAGSFGFAAVGTVFAAMCCAAARARAAAGGAADPGAHADRRHPATSSLLGGDLDAVWYLARFWPCSTAFVVCPWYSKPGDRMRHKLFWRPWSPVGAVPAQPVLTLLAPMEEPAVQPEDLYWHCPN
jgi:hypothetical protein